MPAGPTTKHAFQPYKGFEKACQFCTKKKKGPLQAFHLHSRREDSDKADKLKQSPPLTLKADDISKRGKKKALQGHTTGALQIVLISRVRSFSLAAENLNPRDQLSLLRAVPDLVRLVTFRHTSIQDEEGNSILHLLSIEAEGRLKELLLAKNSTQADPKNKNGRTPLSYAAMCGHEELVRLLLERDDVEADSVDYHGRTPLSFAAERGIEAVVRPLLGRDDVEADSKNKYGRTPLSYTAVGGHEEAVKLLVERDDVEEDLMAKDGGTQQYYVGFYEYEAVEGLPL